MQTLNAAVGSYAAAEAANASPLRPLLNAVNAPTESLLGRPLIGNGTDGAAGTGSGAGETAGPVGCCLATAAPAVPAGPMAGPAVTAGPPG